ncbi:hypothetical protein Tsubulata_045692, partial [Turnera subulata]
MAEVFEDPPEAPEVAGEVLIEVPRVVRRLVTWSDGWASILEDFEKLKRILDGGQEHFNNEDSMNIYTLVHSMCTQRYPHVYSQVLYFCYRDLIEGYLQTTVLPSLRERHNEFLLEELVDRWSKHNVMVRLMSRFFSYLDGYFVPQKRLPNLREVGFTIFRELVFKEFHCKAYKAVMDEVSNLKGVCFLIHGDFGSLFLNDQSVLLDQIKKEREGRHINHALLRNAVDLFGEMVGKDDFEAVMLNDSAEYYASKSWNEWFDLPYPQYLIEASFRSLILIFKSENCLEAERQRAANYLHSSSLPKLVEKIQLTIATNADPSGYRDLLKDNMWDDLSRMYELLHKVIDLKPVATFFEELITEEGMALVKEAERFITNEGKGLVKDVEQLIIRSQALIRKFFDLHDKHMNCVTVCFQDNELFQKSLKAAFEVFCNKTVADRSIAELLARFCDHILRNGDSMGHGDDWIEDMLKKVVILLSYVSNRDVFSCIYREKLADRLLLDQSPNSDHEMNMLEKLKLQFGSGLTSYMDVMIKDWTSKKEIQDRFGTYLATQDHLDFDLSVSVLTGGYWLDFHSSDLELPAEMARGEKIFNDFYCREVKSKKLVWIYSLGTCDILAKFDVKHIQLSMTTFQAAILLLFNTADILSYSDIKTRSNLNQDQLIAVLRSLSCDKYQILVKYPASSTVSETDFFELNMKFTDAMDRIRVRDSLQPLFSPLDILIGRLPIPSVEIDEAVEAVEAVYAEKRRKYAIQAAIVRIMKARKTLGQEELLGECVEQLSRWSWFK